MTFHDGESILNLYMDIRKVINRMCDATDEAYAKTMDRDELDDPNIIDVEYKEVND